jgi:hypothetical protein
MRRRVFNTPSASAATAQETAETPSNAAPVTGATGATGATQESPAPAPPVPPDNDVPNSTASTTVDPDRAAADAAKIKEQLAQQKDSKLNLGNGLSDSARDELMTQLGGHKNMDYEGTRQADDAAKEMAKQSAKWGHV